MENLIGQKVNLKITERTIHYEVLGTTQTHKSYELDDPEMENRIRLTITGNIRFLPPNKMTTMKFRSGRTNVHIDENGIITRISNG